MELFNLILYLLYINQALDSWSKSKSIIKRAVAYSICFLFYGVIVYIVLILVVQLINGTDVVSQKVVRDCRILIAWTGITMIVICTINKSKIIERFTDVLLLLKCIEDDKDNKKEIRNQVIVSAIEFIFLFFVYYVGLNRIIDSFDRVNGSIIVNISISLVLSYYSMIWLVTDIGGIKHKIIERSKSDNNDYNKMIIAKCTLRLIVGLIWLVLICYKLKEYSVSLEENNSDVIDIFVFIFSSFLCLPIITESIREIYIVTYQKYENKILEIKKEINDRLSEKYEEIMDHLCFIKLLWKDSTKASRKKFIKSLLLVPVIVVVAIAASNWLESLIIRPQSQILWDSGLRT